MRAHTLKIRSQIETYLNYHYREIWHAQMLRQFVPTPEFGFLYPTHLLLVESKDHVVAEIFGCRSNFKIPLVVATRKVSRTEDHFDQFGTRDGNSVSFAGMSHFELEGLTFTRAEETPSLIARFPGIRGFGQRYRFYQPKGSGSLVAFGKDTQICVMKSCIFVNARDGIFRVKSVHFALILNKKVDLSALSVTLRRHLPPYTAAGVIEETNAVGTAMLAAGQLQSLFLSPTIHETTIGSFLAGHPSILREALGATAHVYEAVLPWVEQPQGVDREEIRPDMLLRRPDGYWDIVDFKTAVLKRSSVTRGGHARRRFIDYVYEGIAQLGNYADYFSYPANREVAERKYGVKVREPKKILVVGSTENCDPVELEQALRAHPDTQLIDYDSLARAYIASVEAAHIASTPTVAYSAHGVRETSD